MEGETDGDRAAADGSPRAIRVFISSTFRDMQLERDELVKRVFPQVRRMCEQRGVAWGEVDLRWGVTDEQKAEGAVLPICLAEIERTRPYFIGLLGQRYGWVPDELPPGLVDELGWLTDDAGRSVTEVEILHGVLNNPEAAGHAYFYLREPAWVETLPDDERATFVEETEAGRERLEQLRQRVRASGHPVQDYPDPVALGELVLADLAALVESLYPDPTPPEPLDRDRLVHAAFASSRFAGFVARPALAATLDEHADAAGPPLLVTGPSGIGGSALVAAWAAERRASHPDGLVLEHYVEADARAADPATMVHRIVGELTRAIGAEPPSELGEDVPALRSAFGQAMARVDRRVVLVIDAVDRLDDVDGAPDLRWLPEAIPPHVRLVLVASGARPRATVGHRGWAVLEVPPLEPDERRALAVAFLARYSKALDSSHLDRLATAERTGSPRYLRTVLDELRQHGDHFTLGDVIDRLCAAETMDDLLELVLARYEHDFERDRPQLTHDALTAIWAARRGLTEAELLDVLGDGDEPLPHASWSPLHLAAEQPLVSRAGLLGIAHDDLRRAIEDRYLPDPERQAAAHTRLTRYFAARPLGERVTDELGWQQVGAGDLAGLRATLSDLAFTELAYRRGPADVRRLWRHLEAAGTAMPEVYRAVIDDPAAHDGAPGDDRQLVWGVARLLTDAGHPADALRLNRYLVEQARRAAAGRDEAAGGDRRLRSALVNLGAALWSQGALEEATPALGEAVDRCRAAGDDAMLSMALGNLALVLRDRGRREDATALFVEEEAICRRLDDAIGLQASLGNHAQLLRELGRHDEALGLMIEQERLCRDLADDAGITRSLAAQATVLADRGDLAGALALTSRHVERCREEGDVRGLAEALLNETVMRTQAGQVADAAESSAEAEGIARRLGDPGLLARVLVARSFASAESGNWAEVERTAREAELTARQAGVLPQLALALGLVGTARREQGDVAGCRTAHREELQVATTTEDPQAIATARTNLGNVAIAEQHFDEALEHYAAAEPEFRRLDVASSLLSLLANRAQVHQATGRFAEATADYAGAAEAAVRLGKGPAARQWAEPGLQLAYQLGDTARAESLWDSLAFAARAEGDDARLQQALGERALMLINRAQPAGVPGDASSTDQALLGAATALLDEQEQICRRIGDAVGLAACVGNRAIVVRYQGDLAGSLACLDEQLELAQQSGNAQGVLFATANRGEVLGLLGRVAEALHALESARATAQQYGLAPMVQQLDAMIAGLRNRN